MYDVIKTAISEYKYFKSFINQARNKGLRWSRGLDLKN